MMPNRLNEHYIQAAIYCRLSKEDEKKGERKY